MNREVSIKPGDATPMDAGPAPVLTRRQLVIGGALLAAAGVGTAFKPRNRIQALGKAKLEDIVPKEFGGWRFETASGLVLPPADQLRDKIYSQLVTRVYSHERGGSVMALIAYSGSQDGTVQVHRPEVCYPASGYTLTTNAPHAVPLGNGVSVPARYIVAESAVRGEHMIYWTRIGGRFPTRWREQREAVMAENFAGNIPDGVLVRFSSAGSDRNASLLDRFAHDLYSAAGDRLRQVLVGGELAKVHL